MIVAAFPGFLLAGVLFAAMPIALHLLTRRPPEREPLPTAQFLTRDARTLLRLRRRPTDLLLLFVRVLFALTLAAACAGLTWTGQRSGAARVVLLDAGADSLSDWDVVLSEARRLQSETDTDTEAVILAYGLSDGHRIVNASDLERLQRAAQPATAEAGLRALRSAVLESQWETVESVWLTRPSWRLWSPDIGLLRAEIWPGRAPLAPLVSAGAPSSGADDSNSGAAEVLAPPASASAWVFGQATASPLQRAIEALGVRVVSGVEDTDANPGWIYAEQPSASALEELLNWADQGSALVLSGQLTSARDEIPWTITGSSVPGLREAGPASTEAGPASRGAGPASREPSGFVLLGHSGVIGTAVVRQPGAPGTDAHVVAVFEDATPAAAARPLGEGCVVYVAASMLDPAVTASPDFPRLVHALAEGCTSVESSDSPLDRGALLSLERPDLPQTVNAASLGTTGYPLTLGLLFLALMLLALEIGLTREPRV